MRFSDGSVMRLYRQTVEDFCIYAGRELSDEEMTKLRTAAGEMSAKMRAVRIVAASGVSKAELEKRLIYKGEDPAQAKAAVAWMSEMDLLDDRQIARQIVQSCISKGYGLARAKQTLFEKRIPKQLWEDALTDYPDQFEEILSYLQTHLQSDDDGKKIRKVTDALLRRGHSYRLIRKALEQMRVNIEDYAEDSYG